MPEQMPLVLKLLRKARGKPNRKSAMWGAQSSWEKIKERDWPGAVYFAQSATAFDPTWSEGYRMLGLAYRGQERFDEARAALQEALDAGIGDFRMLMDFGDMERSAGDPAAAESRYRNALELQPDDTEAMLKLARSLERQDRLEEATTILTRARALNPHDLEIVRTLGDVLVERGDHNESALPLLEEVTRRDSTNAFGHYYRAVALGRTGNRPEAIAHANKAVELDPGEARYQQLVQLLQSRDN